MSDARRSIWRHAAQAEGGEARAAGVPREHCPAFVDAEFSDCWLRGWDYEDDVITLRRDRDKLLRK